MSEKTNQAELFVAGVGSSAGGLDALKLLLGSLGDPVENLAMVICQHVSPDYKSMLTKLLRNTTNWEVVEAEDEQQLSGGTIYVTPPNYHITFEDDRLDLKEYDGSKPVPSINRFFDTLAHEKGKMALGVVLSGTGSDGTDGMRSIGACGGYTLVQDPGDAKHADMPRAVIESEVYDKIALAQEIPREIRSYVESVDLIERSNIANITDDSCDEDDVDGEGSEAKPQSQRDINRHIFKLLERRTGTNFAKYKPSTIFRRIDKRLDALNLKNKKDYLAYIKENPKELGKLFETVLIGVTEFYRDASAFEALQDHLDEYISQLGDSKVLRVWSVGTATGEEAYSIAMVISEILGADVDRYDIQIFASDLDERALAIARRGHYPHSALENLSPELCERYFTKRDAHYEVRKSLRNMVLFSRHDITVDPPFLKLDLLVCRNLLIYFNNTLQLEVLQTFHYSLKESGLLFIGKSENPSPREGLFERIHDGEKVFRREPGRSSATWAIRTGAWRRKRTGEDHDPGQPGTSHESNPITLVGRAERAFFKHFPHPYVIVNSGYDIVEVHGSIRLYAELKGKPALGLSITKLVNPELSLELRALLGKCAKSFEYQQTYVVGFELFEHEHHVRLHAMPIVDSDEGRPYFLVLFEAVKANEVIVSKIDATAATSNDHMLALEHELVATKEHLALFTEELETSNEELQSMNEELQSLNEELRSANEELETSNEELQSTNEELQTANQELRLSNDELGQKESELHMTQHDLADSLDLYNVLANNLPRASINLVDREYKLTFAAGQLIELNGLKQENLIGMSALQFLGPDDAERMKGMFDLSFAGESASSTVRFNGSDLEIYTLPLSTNGEKGVEQVMLTCHDITQLKDLERSLQESNKDKTRIIYREQEALRTVSHHRSMLRRLVEGAPAQIVLLRGDELVIELANKQEGYFRQFTEDAYGISLYTLRKDFKGSKIDDLIQHAITSGEVQELSELAVDQDPKSSSGEVQYFNVNAIPVEDVGQAEDEFSNTKDDQREGVIIYFTDITKAIEAKRIVEHDAQSLRELVNSLPVLAWTQSSTGMSNFFNQHWFSYTGQDADSDVRKAPESSLHPDDRNVAFVAKEEALKTNSPYTYEARFASQPSKNNSNTNETQYCWHLVRVVPVLSDAGKLSYWIGTAVDIHDQKTLGLKKDEFLNIASHELKTPITAIQGYHQLMMEADDTKRSELDHIALGRMGNSIRRVKRLVSELLTISRIESGTIHFDFESHDLVEALKEAISDVSREGREIQLEGDASIEASFDYDRMIQALENLLSNALKFSPATEAVVCRATTKNKKAVISISDKGAGIPKKDQAYLFERYFRATGSDNIDGMGLGLYITNEIIKGHGGDIAVKSSPRKGSTFTITIPLKANQS